MTRSYSLAPGGWVGNTPGRSGDTQTEENAFEAKQSIEEEQKEHEDFIELLTQINHRNTLQLKELNSPSRIIEPGYGLSPSSINQEHSTCIDKAPIFKNLKVMTEGGMKENTYRTGGYKPDMFDFVEDYHLSGVVGEFDPPNYTQTALPLTHYPPPGFGRHPPVYPLSQLSHIVGNNSVHHQQGNRPVTCLPTILTPPKTPYHTKQSDNTLPIPTMQQYRMGPHYTPASKPQSERAATSTPRAMPARFPGIGSRVLRSPLLDLYQSPNKFATSGVDGIEHFVDRHSGSQVQAQFQHPGEDMAAAPPIYPMFKPSRALLDIPRSVDPDLAYMAEQVGLDLGNNYKGDITKEHIYNAIAPVSDNCALHVINLPSDISLKEVFSIIVGKVFSFQLHAPVPGKWTGCGARLVFTNRAAAENFFYKARSGDGLHIRGRQIRVLWNRDPCRPQEYADRNQSRVLQITGPNIPNFSAARVEEFFSSKLLFKLVDRKEWLRPNGVKVVEIHFPSILGQSRPAMKQFYEMLDETEQRDIFKIQYSQDPCDPVPRGPPALNHQYLL